MKIHHKNRIFIQIWWKKFALYLLISTILQENRSFLYSAFRKILCQESFNDQQRAENSSKWSLGINKSIIMGHLE